MAKDQPAAGTDTDIDPELIALGRPKKGVGPILGLSVLVLAAYLMITLWADFRYGLRYYSSGGDTPTDVALGADPAALPANRYLTIHTQLDFTTTARLRGKQDTGHRLIAARGSGGRLWIADEGEPGNVTLTYDDAYTGRLRRLDDMPWADDLRAYLGKTFGPQPRFVFPEALKGAPPTVDATGEPLDTTPDTRVGVDERVADRVLLTVVASDQIKDEKGAAALLIDNAVIPTPAPAADASAKGGWTWDVPFPGGVEAARATLRGKGLASRTLVHPKVTRREGRWAELAVTADQVTIAGQRVAFADVERLVVFIAPKAPRGASVLFVGESPGTHWWVPPLYLALALISAAMIWAMIRGLKLR